MPAPVHSCPIRDCGQEERSNFSDNNLLVQHLMTFHVHAIFHCVDCRLDLPGAFTVVQHTNKLHNQILPRLIDVRDRADSDSDLEIVDEVLPVLPILSCQRCPFKTRNRMELYEHCSTHPELKFNCIFCSFKCSTYMEIHRHREEQHSNIRPLLKCRFDCGYRSINPPSVRQHEAECPNNQKRYQCLPCGFTTTSDVQYKLHSNSLHHRLRTRAAGEQQNEPGASCSQGNSKRTVAESSERDSLAPDGRGDRQTDSKSVLGAVSGRKMLDIMVNKWTGKVYVNGKPLTEDMRKRRPGAKRVKITKRSGRKKSMF